MTAGPLRVLILGDVHHVTAADTYERPPAQDARRFGCEMITRAAAEADRRGGFDVILQTGDMIDLPGELTFAPPPQAHAVEALTEVRDAIRAAAGDKPVLVVPGNHDGPDADVAAAFGPCGVREIRGYRFVAFNDSAAASDRTRRPEDMACMETLAAGEGGPIITLQHYPLHPDFTSDYTLHNAADVMAAYRRAGVMLAVSGHAHIGMAAKDDGGVWCFTAPGMFTTPRRYSIATLRGRDVQIDTFSLDVTGESVPVVDTHAHSELAYCGKDITAAGVAERSRLMGLAGVNFAEHAPQLYCRAEDFWGGGHIYQPVLWRRAEHSRMAAYRAAMAPLCSEFVRVGFEVELDCDGQLTIHDEDRRQADMLVGAVHWLTVPQDGLSDAEATRVFLDDSRRLCESGIDALAHPWRFFCRANRTTPTNRYAELADILAGTGVVAEINFHTHDPDPAFFAECIARGVKITLASDCHHLVEAGSFGLHLDCLRAAAGRDADLAPLLKA